MSQGEQAIVSDLAARLSSAKSARQAARRRALHDAAFALLLACTASRCFLAELPFQGSALQYVPRGRSIAAAARLSSPKSAAPAASGPATVTAPSSAPATQPAPKATTTRGMAPPADAAQSPTNLMAYQADRSELARMTFAVLILAAGALWALGGAVGGALEVRHGRLAAAIIAFAAVLLASALAASNRRAALGGWLEQVSFLTAAFLAIQLCAKRRRFLLLLAVLAAVGAALALKGFWQRAVEIPERIAGYQAHRLERLRDFGWRPDTPQAMLVEGRLLDSAITGFGPLANPFGSLLLLTGFAAAGLAADKLATAWRLRRQGGPAKRGELHLPTLAGCLAALAAAAVLVALPLTKARGAILAAAVAAIGLALTLAFRGRLAPRWRAWVAGLAAAGLLGCAAVVGYGLSRDGLPTRTMAIRWQYWTASAAIVREHWQLGVGSGNFAAAYLQHRRAGAEEEVQMPHNLVVHALTTYGVPGGVLFLGIVAWLLVGCARPRAEDGDLPAGEGLSPRRGLAILAAAVVAAVAARAAFWEAPDKAFLVAMGLIAPPAALAAMLAIATWSGADELVLPGGGLRVARIALGWGAAGFILHSFVEDPLWIPAMATAFYVGAGACVAQGGRAHAHGIIHGRWLIAGAAVAAPLAAAAILWLPVARKTALTADMLAALAEGDTARAYRRARAAAEADRLDPRTAADAARVAMMHLPSAGEPRRLLEEAAGFAQEAIDRDREDFALRMLAAEVAWTEHAARDRAHLELVAEGDAALRAFDGDKARVIWAQAAKLARPTPAAKRALQNAWQAVRLNPQDARLRIRFAEFLCDAGRPQACLKELQAAQRIDARLPRDSLLRLNGEELVQLATLRFRATTLVELKLIGPAATAPRGTPHDHEHEGEGEGEKGHENHGNHAPGTRPSATRPASAG